MLQGSLARPTGSPHLGAPPTKTRACAESALNLLTSTGIREYFQVVRYDPEGATIADGEGTMTIIDDD